MTQNFDAIVIGGGQAGLAAAYYLQRAGLRFTILEAGTQPVGSWPHYYDSLRLFSPARISALPGLPFPAAPDHYPTRDEVIEYLAGYAAHFRLPVVTGARVVGVERVDGVFHVQTADERRFSARAMIAATGSFHRPYLPSLPGQATFQGNILHAAEYRNAEPFVGQRVIVVGGGNSGVQIGVELAQVARVTLATRRRLRLTPQRILGYDVFVTLGLTRIEALPLGHLKPLREPQVVIDSNGYRRAFATGRLDRRALFARFTSDGVLWRDGTQEPVDTVIFATGYRPNLDYLSGVDALDEHGRAHQRAGASLTTPGLYYVGLSAQRTLVSATLRGVGPDAAYVVRRLARYLQQARESMTGQTR